MRLTSAHPAICLIIINPGCTVLMNCYTHDISSFPLHNIALWCRPMSAATHNRTLPVCSTALRERGKGVERVWQLQNITLGSTPKLSGLKCPSDFQQKHGAFSCSSMVDISTINRSDQDHKYLSGMSTEPLTGAPSDPIPIQCNPMHWPREDQNSFCFHDCSSERPSSSIR